MGIFLFIFAFPTHHGVVYSWHPPYTHTHTRVYATLHFLFNSIRMSYQDRAGVRSWNNLALFFSQGTLSILSPSRLLRPPPGRKQLFRSHPDLSTPAKREDSPLCCPPPTMSSPSSGKRRMDTDVVKLMQSNHEVLIVGGLNELNVKFHGPTGSESEIILLERSELI